MVCHLGSAHRWRNPGGVGVNYIVITGAAEWYVVIASTSRVIAVCYSLGDATEVVNALNA